MILVTILSFVYYYRSLTCFAYLLDFCLQEATAEEVEFDDEEVGPEEVDENKDYWMFWTELCTYDGYSAHELFMLLVDFIEF